MFEDRSKLQLPGFAPPWHTAIRRGTPSSQIQLKNHNLIQYYHLLRGYIIYCLQRIEVGTASHLLSGLSPSVPVDGTISVCR